MRLRDLGVGALACAALVAIAMACSGGGDGPEEPLPGTDASVDWGWGSFDAGVAHDDADCRNQCTADLHQVIDCDGRVLENCSQDKGCFEGKCIPACEAAERSKRNVGCTYYVVDPAEFGEEPGSCFAAYIVNAWSSEATFKVEYDGAQLDLANIARVPSGSGPSLKYEPLQGSKLLPGQVAILFLARYHNFDDDSYPCPDGIIPGVTEYNVKLTGTGLASAFHISADRPLVAYDIYPYGGGSSAATSATLLIPTSAWSTDYMAQAPFTPRPDARPDMTPFLQIVAKADNTKVYIRPSEDIVGNPIAGIAGARKGETVTYALNSGQVLQFAQSLELTGSVIESDQPIGVWGGQNCMFILANEAACDSAHQQIPPIQALGHEYAAVAYRDRLWFSPETPPWRIVGTKDGTMLEYSPRRPDGAPSIINQGQIATFSAHDPFVVKSQGAENPFYMSAHMTGGERYSGYGDPEWVNLIPPEQYLSRYTFFTDPTYPITNLVIVRQSLDGHFSDVTLDCFGPIAPWLPIDADDTLEYARIDLSNGNFEPQGSCDNGVHSMTSEGPFGVTVWGWGTPETGKVYTMYASYAYPAGAGVREVNSVKVGAPH